MILKKEFSRFVFAALELFLFISHSISQEDLERILRIAHQDEEKAFSFLVSLVEIENSLWELEKNLSVVEEEERKELPSPLDLEREKAEILSEMEKLEQKRKERLEELREFEKVLVG